MKMFDPFVRPETVNAARFDELVRLGNSV